MIDHNKDDMDRDELPPWLEELKKRDARPPVPEGYFQTLPDAIMDRIAADKKSGHALPGRGKTVPIRRIGLWVSAIAASLFLIVMVRGFILPTPPASELAGLEEIAPEEALAYAIENPDLYDWEEILDAGDLAEETLPNALIPEDMSTGEIIEELDDELLLELL